MIYFNTKDDQMQVIKEDSKMRSALTAEDYRIYGLKKQEGNSPVYFTFSDCHDQRTALRVKAKNLQTFFDKNGIKFEWEEFNDDEKNQENGNDDCPLDYKLYIGLRRDVRDNIPLCSAIIKTIIYYIDGKIKLTGGLRGAQIPKFN